MIPKRRIYTGREWEGNCHGSFKGDTQTGNESGVEKMHTEELHN
jgi:hypothetical protein